MHLKRTLQVVKIIVIWSLMKTFISLSLTLAVYYVALGQFDWQYCGVQQHLKSFQEIRSALHGFVLSCGGCSVRFKAFGNKEASRWLQSYGFSLGWRWNERNMFLWDIGMRFSDNYNLGTRGQELEWRRGLMLQLWVFLHDWEQRWATGCQRQWCSGRGWCGWTNLPTEKWILFTV